MLAHTSETANRPDNDTGGTYWNNPASGAEESAITTQGDLLYFGGSVNKITHRADGQVLSVSKHWHSEWKDFGAVTMYTM